jgi:hypothetical protein
MYNDFIKSTKGYKNSIRLEIAKNNKEKWYREKEVVAITIEQLCYGLLDNHT